MPERLLRAGAEEGDDGLAAGQQLADDLSDLHDQRPGPRGSFDEFDRAVDPQVARPPSATGGEVVDEQSDLVVALLDVAPTGAR